MKKIKGFLFAFCALLFLLVTPVKAGSNYVEDEYGLLSEDEIATLNNYASEVTNRYNCGVYIRIMPDNGGYSNIETYDENLYLSEGLGVGAEHNGAMFIVTMEEHDYDYLAYGEIGNGAFTDYAKDMIDDTVLAQLSSGNWYEACYYYISESEYILGQYAAGTPVDNPNYVEEEENNHLNLGMTFGVPPVVALLACLGIKSKNKTKFTRTTATNYVSGKGLNLTVKRDIFLNRTQTRVLIKRENDRSSGGGHGTTVNSSGFSHRSGKF